MAPALPPRTGGTSSEQRPCLLDDATADQQSSGSPTDPPYVLIDELPPGVFPDDDRRRMWNIVARKIPYAQRDVARTVLADEDATAARNFLPLGRASVTADNDEEFPVGVTAAYALRLTDAEAARFKQASNALSVQPAVAMSRPPVLEESLFFGGQS